MHGQWENTSKPFSAFFFSHTTGRTRMEFCQVIFYYRPQGSCGQGNIFTPVCHSVHRGVCLSVCWDTTLLPRRPPCQGETPCQGDPLPRRPPAKETPQEANTPPEADSGIQSMSGQYASYWNAFLLI